MLKDMLSSALVKSKKFLVPMSSQKHFISSMRSTSLSTACCVISGN